RDPAPVGHPLRPEGTLSRRGPGQPASRRRGPARLHPGGPRHRRAGPRALAHVRPDPLPPHRGLAGHARRHVRIPTPAGRRLRPPPHARRPAERSRTSLPLEEKRPMRPTRLACGVAAALLATACAATGTTTPASPAAQETAAPGFLAVA